MCVALGAAYTGAYSNSDALYAELEAAGQAEADQFWRMPLSEEYAWHITGSNADLCNINHAGAGLAGSSTAALFLKRFVDGLIVDGEEPEDKTGLTRWAHLDIAGVMDCWGSNPYKLPGGAMTGRPVRTLIEFARRSAKA
jgi:aminopeptidase